MLKAIPTAFVLLKIVAILNTYLLEKYFWNRFARQILSHSNLKTKVIPHKDIEAKKQYLQQLFSYESFYAIFQKVTLMSN